MLQNLEAEASIIGSVLLDNTAMQDIDLDAEDFFNAENQKIWRLICELIGKGEAADIITLSARDKSLTALITDYTSRAFTIVNIPYHADIVRNLALKRSIVARCQQALSEIQIREPEELLSLFQFDRKNRAMGVTAISQVVKKTLDAIERRADYQDTISGVASGFKDLDEATDGWQKGEFIILGGRPSMGKSALAWAFAENAARAGHQPHICNVEMDNHSMAVRALSINSNIDIWRLRKGRVGRHEWSYLNEAAVSLCGLRISMDDTVARAAEIRKSISHAARQGADIAFVDYLQLIAPDIKSSRSREFEMAEISKMLKILAKQLQIPIIAIAQLSRTCEARTDKRPLLSDLRESGQIEQDADIVMFIYRDFYYTGREDDKTKAELIIRKGRHIGNATIPLYFDANKTKFLNWEE